MEKKIAKAIRNLQKSIQFVPISRFTYIEQPSGNTLKAKIFFDEDGKPALKLLQLSGFEEGQIVERLNSDLVQLMDSPLPDPQIGQIVYTYRTAAIGDEITLDQGSYYFGVDNSPLICGGRRLKRSFKGKCKGTLNARCYPDGGITEYTFFKLLS